jgi:hypothetical protein
MKIAAAEPTSNPVGNGAPGRKGRHGHRKHRSTSYFVLSKPRACGVDVGNFIREARTVGDFIERRRQQWYAVVDVPKKLQPVIGKARFVQSLKTTNRSTAVDRARLLVSAWKRRFKSAAGASPIVSEAAE